MSLRPNMRPSQRSSAAAAPSSWVTPHALARSAAAANAEANAAASWWQRKSLHNQPERLALQKQQVLPRLELYVFDPYTQSKPELYAFVYDRNEVRRYYAQSRVDGSRMGELEAVEGYGRADIMAIAWTRNGRGDYSVRMIGHADTDLCEGYVKKSNVRGKLNWEVVLTRLHGQHILNLTSPNLLSLPVYTALATGLAFGLAENDARIRIEHPSLAPTAPPNTINETVEPPQQAAEEEAPTSGCAGGVAEIVDRMAAIGIIAQRPGEGVSLKKTRTSQAKRGGDAWTLLHPWSANVAISSIASFHLGGKGIHVMPQVNNAPIGIIFPTRGTPRTSQGRFIHHMKIDASPVKSILGIVPAHPMAIYRASLYNNEKGFSELYGVIDVIPNAKRSSDRTTMVADSFIATPSIGKTWAVNSGVVTKDDVDRCVNGEVCPWSLDLMSVVEKGIFHLKTGE